MRELARRGGAATKRLAARQPDYYHVIGRAGGKASAAARRAQSGVEPVDATTNGWPVAEGVTASSEAPHAAPRPAMSPYKKIRADLGRPSPRRSAAKDRWDFFAEEQIARLIAQIGQQDSEDCDEPFDELG